MNFVNRCGYRNDTMFNELEQFAQHQKKFDNFHYKCKLQVNGTDKMILEDIRLVFTKPKKVQLKARISELLSEAGLMSFKKTDTVKVIIEPQAPSKEPNTIVTVTEWFEELEGLVPGIENVVDIKVMPNKWLYLAGTES